MRGLFSKKRIRWIVLGVIVPALTFLFLVSGVFQWSPLNCWHDDVDITTGRVRHTRYLLFCQIGDRIEDTWISRAAGASNALPDWQRVNTFSPGVRYSPHYRYHGAINQIQTAELADAMITFDPEARSKVANNLLRLWQNSGSDISADEYVEKVAQAALALHEEGRLSFTAADIPEE